MLYTVSLYESAMLIEQKVRQHFGGTIELVRFFSLPCTDNRIVLDFTFSDGRIYNDAEHAVMEADIFEHSLRLIAGENYYAMIEPDILEPFGFGKKERDGIFSSFESKYPAMNRQFSSRHRIGVQGDAAVLKQLINADDRMNANAVILHPDSDTVAVMMSSPTLGKGASPYTLDEIYEGTKVRAFVYPMEDGVRFSGFSKALDMALERRVSIARLLYEQK